MWKLQRLDLARPSPKMPPPPCGIGATPNWDTTGELNLPLNQPASWYNHRDESLPELPGRASPGAEACGRVFEGVSGAASSCGLEPAHKLVLGGVGNVLIWDVGRVPSRRNGRTGQAAPRGGHNLETRAVKSSWQKLFIPFVRRPGGRAGKRTHSAMASSKW
jgi:hypothetical protein